VAVASRASPPLTPAARAQDGGKGSGFTDNDSLAKELAHELRADLLVLLTNVDGLLDGPPGARGSKRAPAPARAPTAPPPACSMACCPPFADGILLIVCAGALLYAQARTGPTHAVLGVWCPGCEEEGCSAHWGTRTDSAHMTDRL